MHQKLQQAILATRAGKIVEAQQLLIQVLQDDPQEANAWFFLGHLADTEERQVAYLKKSLSLDPDHVKAKQRLMQLGAIPVPLPIVTQEIVPQSTVEEPATAVPQMPTPQPEQKKEATATSQIDHDWRKRAGTPKRTPPQTAVGQSQSAVGQAQLAPGQPATITSKTDVDKTKPDSPTREHKLWLIILLVFIIFGILGIVAYWLYLYSTNSL